ncbi:MAG: cupin domain-containing protein [Hyphomicrobiaceae bacterium]
MNPDNAPPVISNLTAEHYIWGDVCDGWHLVNGADLSVIHERMPAGATEMRHYHQRARQFFFVLSGTLTIERDGMQHAISAGHGLEMRPGSRHQARNSSAGAVEFLVISAPTTKGDRTDVG